MIARSVRELGLSVMIYSGYTLAEARQMQDPTVHELLAYCDVLVDGPFIQNQPEQHRRWIGSANQVVHFLTSRYDPNDPIWRRPNTLEIRLRNGELTVNGFPAQSAASIWKRIPLAARPVA